MKNNQKLLIIVSVLVVVVIGVSFAFFSAGVRITGKGDDNLGTTQEPIKVEYNSGSSALSGMNMLPGLHLREMIKK